MRDITQEILRRHDILFRETQQWWDLWQDCADYVLPNYDISTRRSPGEKRTERIFDSTALHSAELLAASLSGNLTSMSAKWFSLLPRDDSMLDSVSIMAWLDDCSRRLFRALATSNFSTEIHESYLELVVFGTACLLAEMNDEGLVFKTYPIGQYAISENEHGLVDTVFRKYRMTAKNARARWKKGLPSKIEEAKPDKEFEFLHAVYPADDGRDYESYWISVDAKQVLQHGKYLEFPYAVPRWLKVSSESFGRGPTIFALPDIKTLNKAVELELRAWSKAIDPPLMVRDDGVIGDVYLRPGGLTVVRDTDALKPILGGTQWQATELKKAEIRESIRNIYYYAQLSVPDALRLSATEVTLRWRMVERLLGSVLGRIESELLSPLIDRTFGLLYRAGMFMPPPPELEGGQIDIRFESPLAQQQREAGISHYDQFFQRIATVMQLAGPQLLDNFDMDVIIRGIYTEMGLDPNAKRGEVDVRGIREDRAAQAAQAQILSAIQQPPGGGNTGGFTA